MLKDWQILFTLKMPRTNSRQFLEITNINKELGINKDAARNTIVLRGSANCIIDKQIAVAEFFNNLF